MLQERDEGSRDGGYLDRSHVHEVNLIRLHDGEVGLAACLHLIVDEAAVVVERGVALCYGLALLCFGRHVDDIVVVEIHHAVGDFAVRGLDEAEVIDFGVDAERGNKADIRAFRGLDRAKAPVVGVVHVPHLEARALTRQTAGTEGRHTALVRHLGQRVSLVHELRQRIGAEIGVDDRRDGLGVDEVDGGEHLVVTHVHALADGARHTCQPHSELVVELLSYGADAAVGEVVDIIDLCLGVDEGYEVLDDADDVLTGKHLDVGRRVEIELFVDAVTSHFAQVVALLGEEEVLYDLACGSVIRRLGVAQLTIDVLHRLAFGVRGVLVEGVENDGGVGVAGVLAFHHD